MRILVDLDGVLIEGTEQELADLASALLEGAVLGQVAEPVLPRAWESRPYASSERTRRTTTPRSPNAKDEEPEGDENDRAGGAPPLTVPIPSQTPNEPHQGEGKC